jgi:hypothetical protein
VKEALWVRKLMGDVDGRVQRMPLYCDNQSALVLMKQRSAEAPGRSTGTKQVYLCSVSFHQRSIHAWRHQCGVCVNRGAACRCDD